VSSFNAGKIEADLTLGRSQWVKDLRKTQKEIADLEKTGITIGIDADDTNARVVMDNLELMLDDLGRSRYTPEIDVETRDANRIMERLEDRLEAFDRKIATAQAFVDTDNATVALDNLEREMDVLDRDGIRIEVEVAAAAAHRELDLLQRKVSALDNKSISIDADADITNAMIQLDILENQMDVLEMDNVNIQADADTAAAEAKLLDLAILTNNLDNQDFDIQVDVDGYETANAKLLTLQGVIAATDANDIDIDIDYDADRLEQLVGAASSGGGGGGGYLGLLKILIYAIILLSPVLSVMISSATAAIVAFASAVTAAAGAALILGGGLVGLVQLFKDTDPSDRTPAMQAFADSIEAVTDAWDTFIQGIQQPGFELMAQALELVAGILPDLIPIFNEAAEAMSGILDGIASWVDSPQYQEMLDFFGGFGVDMLESFLTIGGNLLVFFGELFAAIEPFAREMMSGIEEVTAGWAEWAAELDENRAFQDFMENAATYGPMVLDMLGSIVGAFMNLGRALEPFAGPMLEGLTFFFDLIAEADPSTLTTMIGIFAGMWAGANILLPILTGIGGAIGAISTAAGIGLAPLALIAGAIGLVVAAVVDLWRENGAFKESVMNIWTEIQETVIPIVEDIWAKIQENWGPITEFTSTIFESVKEIITAAMDIIEFFVVGILDEIQYAWEHWGDEIVAVVTWFFGIVGPMFEGGMQVIAGIFETVAALLKGDWEGAWDGIKKILSGALDVLLNMMRLFTEPVSKAWSNIRDAVVGWWDKMTNSLETKWINFKGWMEEKWGNFKDWIQGWAPNFPQIWEDIKEKWTSMRTNIEGKWDSFKGWVTGWAPNFPAIWDDISAKFTSIREAVETKWGNFKDAITGWTVNAGGIFDSIKEAFRGVLNTIVGWWNNFSLSVDIPDKIPGLPDSFTISTPDVGGYAKGAYVPGNKPHLKWFGEGPDNEVVAPEPILRKIVEEHSGSKIDYARLADAVATAIVNALGSMRGVTPEDLERLIEAASVNLNFWTDKKRNPNDILSDDNVRRLMFELRRLGYGGFGNV